MELRNYETVIVLSPVLDSKQVKAKLKHLKELLTKANGTIIHHTDRGMQNLAYKIQNHTQGLYHIIEYQAPADTTHTLETAYQRDEEIIRFLTVKLSKEGVMYLQKERLNASKQA